MQPIKTIIMGAAGRDFHNFNVLYRQNELYQVVAFTATQIPDIEGRVYPPNLSGVLYPEGIPIHDESKLENLIAKLEVEEVVFSYSDISHEDVMHRASRVLALGAHFKFLGGEQTMIRSTKPVISVCAVRTGCGKSQTTRKVAEVLKSAGKKVAAIRHPMPYGELAKQGVQRFATLEDLAKHDCTIEEMEEYEPHISRGTVVFAGADYEAIVREAEKEADFILWDGGNNDMPFYKPDLSIVVTDPHRAGHELTYHPGETNLMMADVVIINKVDTAEPEGVETVRRNVQDVNPEAVIIEGASPVTVENSSSITGKKVLVVEDGPTLTHGDMKIGAGIVAAKKFGASETVDPRPYLVGKLVNTFEHYPDIGTLLPAMGYGNKQIRDLEETINNTDCDLVIIGTPIDLRRIINFKHPTVRVTYDLEEKGSPTVADVLKPFIT